MTQDVVHIRKVEDRSEQRARAAAPHGGYVRKQEVLKQHAGLGMRQGQLPSQAAAVSAVRLCMEDEVNLSCSQRSKFFVSSGRVRRVLLMTVPGGRTVSCGDISETSAEILDSAQPACLVGVCLPILLHALVN